MKYAFVADAEQLQAFGRLVLGDESKVIAFASVRKKYHPDKKLPSKMKSGSSFYRHETSGGDLLRTATRMCGTEGMYPMDDGTPAEPEWMALYVTVNARDPVKAAKSLAVEITHTVFETGAYPYSCLSAKAIGHLMKPENAVKRWVTIDIDDVEKNYATIKNMLDMYHLVPAYTVTTRGGYHLLFDLNAMTGANKAYFFNQVKPNCPETIDTDMACPIPGTMQGGHLVTFCPGFP